MKLEYFPKVAIQQDLRNNSNNHFEYSPFVCQKGKWYVDSEYVRCLPDKELDILSDILDNVFTVKELEYPHEVQILEELLTSEQRDKWWELYKFFTSQFREEKWLPQHPTMWLNKKVMMKVSTNEVKKLYDCAVGENGISSLHGTEIFLFLNNNIIENKEYFIKLSCGSVKHDWVLKPVQSVKEALEVITYGRRFLKEYNDILQYKWIDTHIIITPWVELDERNEFRVIIKHQKIRGICNQKWWEFFWISNEEKEKIVEAIESLIEKLPDFPNAVLDVYYYQEKAWLIEMNAYGPGLSSGSGLFHWMRDYSTLCGPDQTETVWKVVT